MPNDIRVKFNPLEVANALLRKYETEFRGIAEPLSENELHDYWLLRVQGITPARPNKTGLAGENLTQTPEFNASPSDVFILHVSVGIPESRGDQKFAVIFRFTGPAEYELLGYFHNIYVELGRDAIEDNFLDIYNVLQTRVPVTTDAPSVAPSIVEPIATPLMAATAVADDGKQKQVAKKSARKPSKKGRKARA